MIQFLSDCSGLFNDIFGAVMELDFFLLLAGVVLIRVCMALFLLLCRGTRKM